MCGVGAISSTFLAERAFGNKTGFVMVVSGADGGGGISRDDIASICPLFKVPCLSPGQYLIFTLYGFFTYLFPDSDFSLATFLNPISASSSSFLFRFSPMI